MTETAAPPDRRQRRRQESIEEILDVSVALMATNGVAGLSLGEVARQMGIRPPSLYVYFDSKEKVYDALFARGAQGVLDAVVATYDKVMNQAESLEAALQIFGTAMVRWAIDNPVYSQLLFWRPVPGFVPTESAYLPAIELVARGRAVFGELQQRGWVRSDVAADDVLRDWTVLIAGIVSQQLSNEPEQDFASGAFTSALPGLVAMFARYYAMSSTATKTVRKARS